MADSPAAKAPAAPKGPRMLFNRSGMAYKLKPGADGKVIHFASQTAFLPRQDVLYGGKMKDGKLVDQESEEKFLLDYHGVVYADTIITPGLESQRIKELETVVADLTKERDELKAKQNKGSGK